MYLNSIISEFVSEVQSALKVQNFTSNGEILSDRIKCPSSLEVGFSGADIDEGEMYPLFGDSAIYWQQGQNILSGRKAYPSNYVNWYYWARSRYCSNGSYAFIISDEGKEGTAKINTSSGNSTIKYSVLGILRF